MTGSTRSGEAVERLPSIAQATVSPDGRRVAFYYAGSGATEIRVLDLESGDHERWTGGNVGSTTVWPLAWTADGDRVLFHRGDGDGSERFDLHSVNREGETRPVVETAGSTQLRDVGPDGDRILVRSTHGGGMDAYLHDRPAGELRRLTDRDGPVYYPALSTDGRRVALPAEGSLHVCDPTGEVRAELDVASAEATATPVDWGPDGDRILVDSDDAGVNRPGVAHLGTGDVTWFGGEYVEEPEFFLPGGRRFVVLRQRDALTVPVVYDVETGECREFALPDGVAHFGRRSSRAVDEDRVLVTHATPTHLPELLVYDLSTDEYRVALERDHGPFDTDDFATPRYERVRSNGVPDTRQAAVEHDPSEAFEVQTLFWDSGARPSPLVVYPHGGPHQASRRTFQPRVQFLCQRGYSVLQVNYRGSSDRGRAFRRALYGDWGGAEQGDVATAVERALDEYAFLDADRVAVYGGSYGGYSAYWQLVQYPDLYDAGAAIVGMADLVDMYENTAPQFRSGFLETHLGSPEENPDLYRERSPVTHAGNLSAPLLIVHGENDPRVPVSQARRFRAAFREADAGDDARVEYHELDDGGHWGSSGGVSRPLSLLDDFLDRTL